MPSKKHRKASSTKHKWKGRSGPKPKPTQVLDTSRIPWFSSQPSAIRKTD